MSKLNKNISIEDIIIDEICTACSSLIKEANMTDEDIDEITKKVKNGTI